MTMAVSHAKLMWMRWRVVVVVVFRRERITTGGLEKVTFGQLFVIRFSITDISPPLISIVIESR